MTFQNYESDRESEFIRWCCWISEIQEAARTGMDNDGLKENYRNYTDTSILHCSALLHWKSQVFLSNTLVKTSFGPLLWAEQMLTTMCLKASGKFVQEGREKMPSWTRRKLFWDCFFDIFLLWLLVSMSMGTWAH